MPPVGATQRHGVRVTVEPTELTVDPGSEVTTTVTVRNPGTRVEQFRLAPGGPAARFASVTPATLAIYPGDEQRAVLRFAPVRGPQSPAGVTPFDIAASSVIHTDVIDVGHGHVTVTPFQELHAVLRPEVSRGRRASRHQVSVTNDGNTAVNAQLAFRDQNGELTFEPPSGAAILWPGDGMSFPVRINGPRRWFGRTERRPFSAVITPTGPQQPITLYGTRCQNAVFPWWIPTAALAIVAIAIALYAAWPGPTVPQVGDFTQTAAEKALQDEGYVISSVTRVSAPKQAGLVVRTDPAAGSKLAKGKGVQVFVSTGPCDPVCQVLVPATKGKSEAEARAVLSAAGFTVGQVDAVSNELSAGAVTATSPAEVTVAATNVAVTVFLSSGPLLLAGPPSSSAPPLDSPHPPPSSAPPQPDLPPGQPVPPPPDNPLPRIPAPRTPAPLPPTPPPPPPAEKCSPTPSADRPADGLTMTSPGPGAMVGADNQARGTANLKSSERLWLLLCAPLVEPGVGGDAGGFYIESEGPVSVSGGAWTQEFGLNTAYPGDYILYAVIVNAGQDPYEFVAHDGGGFPFGRQLPQNAHYVHVSVKCCR